MKIKPFRGFRYNPDKISRFEDVITPPYDIISKAQKRVFREKSPYNFSHLILPKPQNGTDKYLNAGNILEEWIREGIIVQDHNPALYVYSQVYPLNGTRSEVIERLGFIALVDLSRESDILPHEQTLQKPFEDRLQLTTATGASLGLVFSLYDDRPRIIDQILEKAIRESPEDLNFVDDDQVVHRLWKVTDMGVIEKVTNEMEQYSCIIADGHHRFKVAKKYYENLLATGQATDESRFTSMCFVNLFHEGLILRPVNRLVFNIEKKPDFAHLLEKQFSVEKFGDIHAALDKLRSEPIMIDKKINYKNHNFVVYNPNQQETLYFKLRDPLNLQIPSDHSDVYTKTDVNLLHRLILEDILGISPEDQFRGTYVEYVKGDEETLEKVQNQREKKYQYAFFINSPLMREVFLTSRGGETMPQKSTYFYPKLYSGLVFVKVGR